VSTTIGLSTLLYGVPHFVILGLIGIFGAP
jgi:hypothetical protein